MAADRRAGCGGGNFPRIPCSLRCSALLDIPPARSRQTLARRVLRYYSGGSYEELARRAKYASTFTLCKQNVNRNPQLFAFDLAAPPARSPPSGPVKGFRLNFPTENIKFRAIVRNVESRSSRNDGSTCRYVKESPRRASRARRESEPS